MTRMTALRSQMSAASAFSEPELSASDDDSYGASAVEDEAELPSTIKPADRAKARECAGGIEKAAVSRPAAPDTPAEAIELLRATALKIKELPAEASDMMIQRLEKSELKFYPPSVPNLYMHPESTNMADALFAMVTDEVVRLPRSRKAVNHFESDTITTVSGVEFAIAGFILAHATSPTKLLRFQDLTAQPMATDWIAVLYNVHAEGVAAMVCTQRSTSYPPTSPHTACLTFSHMLITCRRPCIC